MSSAVTSVCGFCCFVVFSSLLSCSICVGATVAGGALTLDQLSEASGTSSSSDAEMNVE